LEAWLDGHRRRVDALADQIELHPVIREFRELIHSDPVVRMYGNQMIAQVPSAKPYRNRHVKSIEQLLLLINEVLTTAPSSAPQWWRRPWERSSTGRWGHRPASRRIGILGSTRCSRRS
jgi:hypothetical protein